MNDKAKIALAVRRATGIARIIGFGLLGYGLYLSAGHITEVGHLIGLTGAEAGTLFIFVDIVALLGKLLTSKYFVAKTRRIGYKLMLAGGLLSLACNVAAGGAQGNPGRAAYGAFIVLMIVVIEYATVNIKGKTVNTEPRVRTPKAPPAVELPKGRKCEPGCGCGKHKSRYPVSPGVGPVGDYAGRKA
ncbi:MAG TPA: hypothetical protein VF163_16335 [Micromonosporaceae bacterium]